MKLKVRIKRKRRGGRLPYGIEVVLYATKLSDKPHYVVINADESEPGTVKR